jgi:signal transduction histidine kinase
LLVNPAGIFIKLGTWPETIYGDMTVQTTTNPQQDRLAALYAVSSRLGTTLDLGDLLNLVMDAIIQLTGAERGLLVLQNRVTGELETAAARNMDQQTVAGRSMKISRSIIRRAIDEDQPILTDNAQADNRFSAYQSVVSFRLRSIMCTPLRARNRVIGAVYVDNRLYSAAFAPADLDLLLAFAGQAAVAIENARLFQQTDQALARRVEELTILQRIDQELNRSLDLDQVLSLALEWALRLTTADGGSIGLLHATAENGPATLQLLAYRGPEQPLEERTIPASHPLLRRLLAGRESIITTSPSLTKALDSTLFLAQLAVPILREGQVIGLISLESTQTGHFTAEDTAFVERLADRAAVAIENSRLYAEAQAANDAKNAFISIITHELRLPMTVITGYTDLLLQQLAGPLNEDQITFLRTVRRNTDRMNVLIRDLADINRLETGRLRLEPEPLDLAKIVHQVARDLHEDLHHRQQTLDIDLPAGLPPVYTDRTRLAQILSNLLTNAHKYTPDGGHLALSARTVASSHAAGSHAADSHIADSHIAVAITDDGLGISPADQQQLFNQFYRAAAAAVREQAGWGLGLSIVKMLVEAQGGQIDLESEPDVGSTFTFTIPLAGTPAGGPPED